MNKKDKTQIPSANSGETNIRTVSNKSVLYKPLPSINGVKFGPTFLSVEGDVDMNQGRNLLKDLLQNASATAWQTGDLLVYLADRHGKGVVAQLAEDLNLAYGTLANKKLVSSKIPTSLRNEKLSWDHHRLVAKLETDNKKQSWLNKAARFGWTTHQLRKKLNASTGTATSKTFGIPGITSFGTWLDKVKTKSRKLGANKVKALRPILKSLLEVLPKKAANKRASKVAGKAVREVMMKPVAELVLDAVPIMVAADVIKANTTTASPAA
jgi:hypothetical protein